MGVRSRSVYRVLACCLGLVLTLAEQSATLAQDTQDSESTGYGVVYSYYNTSQEARAILAEVEAYHLQEAIDRLNAGEWRYAIDECDYILDYFPDHPQALYLLSKAAIGGQRLQEAESRFKTAKEKYPGSVTTFGAYAMYKYELGEIDEAIEAYKQAIALSPAYAEAHYNIGLLYAQRQEFRLANAHAQVAYANRYPLPGLQNILVRNNAWQALTETEAREMLGLGD